MTTRAKRRGRRGRGRGEAPHDALTVGEVLETALRRNGLSDQARRLRIYRRWHAAVGPKVASRTEPTSFQRGVLTVKAANASWQNELTFLKATIIEKLNAVVGEAMVHDLRIVGGRVHAWTPDPPPPPKVLVPSQEDREAAQATSMPIKDDTVRDAFERLMAKARCADRQS